MERKTLFDYFKLPKKRETVDVSHSDGLDAFSFSSDCGSVNSDPVLQESKRRRADDGDGDEGFGGDIRNSLESPFVESEAAVGEERYRFLADVRDRNGRRRGEEGYDPSSLFIPEAEFGRLKPFEKQFWNIKKDYFDTLVFFKKGSFYELYEDDAVIGARLFDFKIVNRVNMKMCGFPENSVDYWARRFLEQGYRIARVEQSENMIGKQIREKEDRSAKREKIIHRELREIITQGTIYNGDYLQSAMPVYLMAAAVDDMCYSEVCEGKIHTSVVLYDASVSEVYFSSFCDDEERHGIKTILSQYDVKEVVSEFPIEGIPRTLPDKTPAVSDRKYSFSNEREYLCFLYLTNYMKSLKRPDALKSVRVAEMVGGRRFMVLDDITLRNMEVFRNSYNGTDEKTLFRAINLCTTPFGQRLLRRWLMAPLMDRDEIVKRQCMAQAFADADGMEIRRALGSVGDAERNMARLHNGNSTLKDLNSFLCSVEACGKVFDAVHAALGTDAGAGSEAVQRAGAYSLKIDETLRWYRSLYRISEGEISPGEENNDELCVLLDEKRMVDDELGEYLERQRTRLRCRTLRYRDVGRDVFQIEAPKELDVPGDYFIVSSTKAVNRFYSGELKELVRRHVECEERIFQSKGMLLRRAVEALSPHTMMFHQLFSEVAHIDCYLSFAAFGQGKSLPDISSRLSLAVMSNPIYPDFVPNDYAAEKRVLVLTGPNMGGKSTLLRTMCLNIILSQMGMKVCCKRMETPLFDRIFTRIGASDNLAKGESTFMVELSETANILRHSSERSFIAIDELGRGTSTRDGECIAMAVLEYLRHRGSHVMFSTHYHKIVGQMEGISNGYMSSVIRGRDIVFLYKLVSGLSLDSHGLYVARMAGVPDPVVERAEEVRRQLQG